MGAFGDNVSTFDQEPTPEQFYFLLGAEEPSNTQADFGKGFEDLLIMAAWKFISDGFLDGFQRLKNAVDGLRGV